ncbi:sensor domain-containing diguanylate cyclase [Desulfosporosinus metallidurans]|uniref:Diguanylate cyclase/phosphodiesterase (GGDEF & EAL domains) with PAS/PAC sensor(S) n=1 Tax=Desulfosporosinus metallidurans TaxID=1888891 RepID=A0A1Q8QWH0_9FIRM|nr:sensor domain-containing diguanylate cyclase [Desulfosporosinus metallidurans]OLN31673.1 diguanylate cyclase/phosphodiesterase (GGDEF & EAL domains) with PAS/PAC sensor(s) [Desulfosporosinus metallidurans]
MAENKNPRTEKVKTISSVSNHRIWSFGMISLMLGLTVLMILLGHESIFFVSFFYLMVALAALYLPLRLIVIQVTVASILTWIVLYQDTHQLLLSQWFVNTLVYLGVGMAVNREVATIRQIQRHNEEMTALSHISTSLTKTLNLNELTSQVVDHIFTLFLADGCTIFLMDEEKKTLRVISARENQDDPEILDQVLSSQPRVGFGMVGWIAATGEPIISGDAEHDARALHIPGTPFDDESVMGIPLKAEGETFGVLWIYKLGLNAFSDENLRLAQIFANQVSVALANSRLYEHVRHLSETDGLTGLLNSRSLLDLTERAINHAQTTGGCVSLFFIDCDNFKKINDCFGHPVGDQFLRFFASQLLEGVREGDVVIRYAGDEFVILLPNTNLEAAKSVGERLIETTRVRIMENNPRLHTTVSMGLATYPEHAKSAEELIKHADDALYSSKRNGKDQLNVYIPSYESVCS